MMSQHKDRQCEQLSLVNPIDLQAGHYTSQPTPIDPTWDSPRTGPSDTTYNGEPIAETPALKVGDTVRVLPFTDVWGFARGQFDKATITAIQGERVTLTIPGIVERKGYVCGIERVQKL